MKKILVFIILILISIICSGQKQREKYYQDRFAEIIHGEKEVVLDDKTRVDIVTDSFAIEVDFAHKWAESIGQSIHYARKLNKKAGILLIIDGMKDDRFVQILMPNAKMLNITVWVVFIDDNTWGLVEEATPIGSKNSRYIY